MQRLRPRDLRALAEYVRDTYTLRDLGAFPHHIVRILRQVIPADCAWYDAATPRGRTAWVVDPFDTFPGAQRVFAEYMHQHPCFLYPRRISNGLSWRLSDYLSPRRLHGLELYNEYYRRRGIEYQLGMRLTTSPSFVIAVGVNRGRRQRDFSDDAVRCMNVLGPHLIAAYRGAEALTELRTDLEHVGRLEDMERGVVIVRRGDVQFVSPRARRLLDRYLGPLACRPHALPDLISRWLSHQQRWPDCRSEIPLPRHALVIERGENHLRVRLVADAEQAFLLLDERQPAVDRAGLTKLGLTQREAEVLAWVARGKTNEDTAMILGARPATIAKHLEHIFRKLHVETRTAAAALAFEATGQEGPDTYRRTA
jgi:DNA-binding CsgD family transcriptional regulator